MTAAQLRHLTTLALASTPIVVRLPSGAEVDLTDAAIEYAVVTGERVERWPSRVVLTTRRAKPDPQEAA